MAVLSDASKQQVDEIDQLDQVVGEINGVTQQSLTRVAQAASAAATVREQASSLAELLGTFTLEERLPKGQAASQMQDILGETRRNRNFQEEREHAVDVTIKRSWVD